MNYGQLLKVSETLPKLTAEPLKNVPVSARKDLFFLTKSVNEYMEFYANEQRKLAEMYGRLENDGTVYFDGETEEERAEKAKPFIDSMTELNNTDVEIKSVQINCDELQDISINDMLALSPIIDFFT